jgi:FkbM family methyltransferase
MNLKKFLSPAYYKHALVFRYNRMKRNTAIQQFVKGSAVTDKAKARLLALSMEQPFEKRPQEVLDYFEQSGEYVVSVKHIYFHGLNLEFDLSDNFEMAICREFFIEHAYDLKKLQFVPERIIDCGAYRGYFSFQAQSYFPGATITAIEAHPGNYEKIKTQLESNNIRSIELVHGAVTRSTDEFITLFFEGSSGSLENTFSTKGEHVPVKTVSLEQFIHQNNLLLKIDIEGAELDFFPEIISRLPTNCAIFIETHDGWNSLKPIRSMFIEKGFSFEVISERNQFIDSFAQRVVPNN